MKKLFLILAVALLLSSINLVSVYAETDTPPPQAAATTAAEQNSSSVTKDQNGGNTAAEAGTKNPPAAGTTGNGDSAAKAPATNDVKSVGDAKSQNAEDGQNGKQNEDWTLGDWPVQNILYLCILVLLVLNIIFTLSISRKCNKIKEEIILESDNRQSAIIDQGKTNNTAIYDHLKRINTRLDKIEQDSNDAANKTTYQEPQKTYSVEPITQQYEAPKPKTVIEKYNDAVNNNGDLSMLGFAAVDISNIGYISITEVSDSNAKFYVHNKSDSELEIYPSSSIKMGAMGNIFLSWYDISRYGNETITLNSPCKINKNTLSGKYELISKGQITIY